MWNPATDPELAVNYSALRIDMRARNKAALQQRLGLAVAAAPPLFGVVSRLTLQKGLDLLLDEAPDIVGRGGQLALLGSGEKGLEDGLSRRRRAPILARSPASSATTRACRISCRRESISSSFRRASSLAGSPSSAACVTARRRSSRASAASPTR